MRYRRLLALALPAVGVATLCIAPSARADSNTQDSTMAPNYRIEARIWKDSGNGNPTRWSTSAWTYHGAAFQSMSWIRDTASIQSWGGTFTFSCTAGSGGGNCTGTTGAAASNTSVYWQNGNTYESDLNGVVHPNFGVYWLKICSDASAYSQSLGIKGTTEACVG